LTPEEPARAERRLLNPQPGSRIEAAKKYRIDLTLLLAQLRVSPADRAWEIDGCLLALEKVRGLARGLHR